MKRPLKKIEVFFVARDLWVFAVPMLSVSLFKTLEVPPFTWAEYLSYNALLGLFLSPLLLFEGVKHRLKAKLSKTRYVLAWSAVFALYLIPIWSLDRTWLQRYFHHPVSSDFLVVAGWLCLGLKVVLELSAHLQKRIPSLKWLQKIGLDQAILLVLLLISLLLSLMGVSSLYRPELHTREQLLIGYVFDFQKIIGNLPTFFAFWAQFFLMYLAGFFFYFLNRHFLIPNLLQQRGILLYSLGLVGSVFFFYPLWGQLIMMLPLNRLMGGILSSAFASENAWGAFAILLISLPVILALQWFQQNAQIMALKKEKVQSELERLKQQINPHFFFNTLNNLYALSLTQSEQTPEVIMQLSELMRYVIYQGKQESVALSQEVKYMEDYIQLQQIRLHKHLDFRFDKRITDERLPIPPLLLITFLENAFKHGIEPAEGKSTLHLSLKSEGKILIFSCVNSFEPMEDQPKGLGLDNLKRRLDLLFPEAHQLCLQKDPGFFTARLTLHLS